MLFADITGSTRLFETVGDAIARTIEREWLAQVNELLPRFDGRLVKTIGDEVMCVFPSAEKGALAASAIQSAVTDNPPAGYEIQLHIGLHWGKVVLEDADVFGDVVNVTAYLAALAAPEQIVTTEEILASVPDYLKSLVRPVFQTVFKGRTEEVIVYEVLWKTDRADLTDSFFLERSQQLVPTDKGGMLLKYREHTMRLDRQTKHAVLGRHSTCNLVIRDPAASRYHARIELRGMEFYLNDISINGTFVIIEGRPEIHVVRRDLRLDGVGKICLGRSFNQDAAEIVEYSRDRRALFRI